jgi:hypothetical protein
LRLDSLIKIFKEAADLAHEIHLSPQPCGFVIDFRHSDRNRDRVLFGDEKTKYRIINAANCQPLRESDIIEVGPNGRIGKKLCVNRPALVGSGGAERDDITLTKEAILVALDHPTPPPTGYQHTSED